MLAAIAAVATLACTAPRVIDGDTIDCAGRRVRIFGIDAPEMHGPSHLAVYPDPPPAWVAEAARHRLAELARGGLSCAPAGDGQDRYGRMVAICVSPERRDVGAELVREGLARDWPRYSGGAYAGPQDEARRAHAGMWR